MRNSIVMAAFSIILMGCATSYQKESYTGGFSETQLGENVFQVSFSGNSYTSRKKASDFTLLRAAELSLENGFKYFIVVDSEKYTSTRTQTMSSSGKTFVYSNPTSVLTITGFKEKPETSGLVYEADIVVKSINAKYDIKH